MISKKQGFVSAAQKEIIGVDGDSQTREEEGEEEGEGGVE